MILKQTIITKEKSEFGDFVDGIYSVELELKDTLDTVRYAEDIDIHFEVDSEGRLSTKLYDKRDDVNFLIVNIPFYEATFNSTFIWNIYVSVDTVFQSLWFLSGFP